jgi:hypothetical protein
VISEGLAAVGLPVNRKGILAGSLSPDTDYVLTLAFHRAVAHRTYTHSLSWTALVALLLGRRWGFWSTWLGGISHLAADEFNSCDRRRGYWPRLMWFFPLELFRRPWQRCVFDMGKVPGPKLVRDLIIEGPVLLLALGLVWQKVKR